jgi:hypothetical protein
MKRKKGSILVLSMFVMAVLLLFGGIMLELTLTNIMMITKEGGATKAYWIAFAGISKKRHDLKEFYFQNQMGYEENIFGGTPDQDSEGKYKIGAATLIGQGFHKTILVSLGEYKENKSSEEASHKKCIYSIVSMNTPSDYLHFYEGPNRLFQNKEYGVGGRPFFHGGAIHVNGDIQVGAGYSASDMVFAKSSEDYGPVISASGTIYSYNSDFNKISNAAFGQLQINFPFSFSYGNFTDLFYSKKIGTGLIWKGSIETGPVPIDNEKFPTKVIVSAGKSASGKEYSYDLLQDKRNGGSKISVPTMKDISKSSFLDAALDPNWIIEDFNWSNPAAKTYTIVNDSVTSSENFDGTRGRATYFLGNLQFGSSNGPRVSYAGISGINPKYIKFPYLQSPETYYAHTPGLPAPMVPPFLNDRSGKYFEFNTYNREVKLYGWGGDDSAFTPVENLNIGKGLIWGNFFFRENPKFDPNTGGTKWYGTYSSQHLNLASIVNPTTGITTYPTIDGSGNITYNVYDGLSANPNNGARPFNLIEPIILKDDGGPYREKVVVNGELWTRVDSLSGTGITNTSKVYTVNFTSGGITFGNGTKGAKPTGAIIARWTHGFHVLDGSGQPAIKVYIHPPYPVVEIDLDKIDESNCPKYLKDPDNPNKFGIIYSKKPLVIRGKPKVPVTIFCEDSVHVGPVNSAILNDNLDIMMPSPSTEEDGNDFCPVGIITKKHFFCDFTYAPVINPVKYDGSNPTVGIADNAFNLTTGSWLFDSYKMLTQNKVYISYPWASDTLKYDDWGSTNRSSDNLQFTRSSMGGIVSQRGIQGYRDYYHYQLVGLGNLDSYKFIGSSYSSYDADYVKEVTNNYNNWRRTVISSYQQSFAEYYYSSSFRYWDANRPFTSGPPPHIPMSIKTEQISGGGREEAQTFFTELNNVIQTNSTYSVELADKINKLIETIE